MKKKYYILVLAFLCMLVGQSSYAQTSGGDYGWDIDLPEICVGAGCDDDGGSPDSGDPCDIWSSSYDYNTCHGGNNNDTGDPCDPLSSAYNPNQCGGDTGDPCDPYSYAYDYTVCYGETTNPDPPIQIDPEPCDGKLEAENKSNSIPNNIQSSTADALDAASAIDGFEHGITFGKDANGQITQAPIRDGGVYNVPVTQNWPGAFAAVHNHVVDYPPSAGDVYTAVTLVSNNPNFVTSYINLPNGDSYAMVVTNPELAKEFVTKYPKDQTDNNPPEFPIVIFDHLQDLVPIMGSSTEGKINAIVATLDKYKSGISILKKDSVDGSYVKIAIKQTTINGITNYQLINCP
ncbi:hypothetical protein ACHRV1_16885 [Flavobacterium aquidurense]|uniref:Uncharacterized protein n=1 Tax=Flavobacterium piscisymbiosum TaxID=2893753 RepID=A0ABS8MHN5_9FLAO|nr:hypothetical protein [Flavobacterium sp. F-30]MCC9065009.1 hypothetical protein [Flavobacterium sp. F-30]